VCVLWSRANHYTEAASFNVSPPTGGHNGRSLRAVSHGRLAILPGPGVLSVHNSLDLAGGTLEFGVVECANNNGPGVNPGAAVAV
jgi:hypothetical protein